MPKINGFVDAEMAVTRLTDWVSELDKRVTVIEQSAKATQHQTSFVERINSAKSAANTQQDNGFVAMNTWGSLNTKPTGVIGPDSNAKTIMEYRNFIEALLDLDCYALNVTEEVRNAARKVLGR